MNRNCIIKCSDNIGRDDIDKFLIIETCNALLSMVNSLNFIDPIKELEKSHILVDGKIVIRDFITPLQHTFLICVNKKAVK